MSRQPKRANQSAQPFLNRSWQSSSGMPGHVLSPNNCPFAWGIWAPSNTCLLGTTWVHNLNGISIGSAVFAQMIAHCLYTLKWGAHPLKIALPMGDLDHHQTHGSLGPPACSTQMASRSVQPFLQGSLVWQTDHATRSITIGHIYVRNNNKNSSGDEIANVNFCTTTTYM